MTFITPEQVKLFNEKAEALNVLPVKFPPLCQKLVREEDQSLGYKDGPLYRVVYPTTDQINDHVQVLTALLRKFDALCSRSIKVFIPDPISYLASSTVPLKHLFRLVDELYWTTGFWTNGVLPVFDSPVDKERSKDIVAWPKSSELVTFLWRG